MNSNSIKTSANPFGALKRESAALVLQGLRREAYAGVLNARKSRVGEAYICDLLLDGWGRKLEIRITGPLTTHRSSPDCGRITAAIHGLSFLLVPPKVELLPSSSSDPEQPRFVASIDLQVAILHLNVLPCALQESGPAWVCILEIHRQEGC
jgi:hypothetical protein